MSASSAQVFTPAVIISLVSASVALFSAGLATFGQALAWRRYREESLRKAEVHAWADEVIAALEGLVMICILRAYPTFEDEAKRRLASISFETAILVERGRIFFRNQPFHNFGSEKKPAYRGLRPKVLDPLVAAHQVAVRLPSSKGEQVTRLQCVAEDQLKEFVSLIQIEVGRQRTAAADTQVAGMGFNLDRALAQVSIEHIRAIERMRAKGQPYYREGSPQI